MKAVTEDAERRAPTDEFNAFFHAVEPRLRQSLVAKLGPDRGRDATAEAMAWAFQNWERVSSLDQPVGYLRRVGISHTRARKEGRLVQAAAYEPSVSDTSLIDAVRNLSENQRQAVVLVCACAWELREVAELNGKSVSTISTHLRRGLKRLRKQLGELDE